MRKDYKHPEPYRPDHDYLGGIHAADKHIKDMTKAGTHPGQAQHLGGMASYKKHLERLHDGEAHKVREEIKHVLDYLFYFHQTDHDIFHFLAKEIQMRAEKMVSEIQDPQEKEHAQYFVDAAREYMHKLKEESEHHRAMGHHGGHSPYVHDSKGKMITPKEMDEHDRNPDQFNLRMEGVYNARRGGRTRGEMEYDEMRRRTTGPRMDILPYEDYPMMPNVPWEEYRRRGGTRSEAEYNEMRRGGQGGSRSEMYPQWPDTYDAYRRQGGTRSEMEYNEMRRGGRTRSEMESEEMRRGGQGGSRSEMETNRQNPQGANPSTVNL